MKKLLRHMSPLAPDDSGACGVLYEMGGITVICDAGGCAGNVCGFDEPRWHEKKIRTVQCRTSGYGRDSRTG